ncbi:MAG: hypothetical protein KF802_11635 [Bdellovibrionaceae bacterium]|nr:hypothetical protein [Pseudobdellovibrionaceae bacterium]
MSSDSNSNKASPKVPPSEIVFEFENLDGTTRTETLKLEDGWLVAGDSAGGSSNSGCGGDSGSGSGGNDGGNCGGGGGKGGDGSSCCFTAGVPVLLADGRSVAIEMLKAGDRIASMEGPANMLLEIIPTLLGDRQLFGFNEEEPFVTAEHPFWTPEGWKSIDPEATKKETSKVSIVGPLRVGDRVMRDGEWLEIRAIHEKTSPRETIVYNIMLTGDHTYRASGYLVHNKH